jgi:hypothetical protein
LKRDTDDPLIHHRLPPDELGAALDVVRALVEGADQGIVLKVGLEGDPIYVPPALVDAFMDVASALACRNDASMLVFSDRQEVSPQQAADILEVSMTIINKLCDSGALAFRLVGKTRRIGLTSVAEYHASGGIAIRGHDPNDLQRAQRITQRLETVNEARRNYTPGKGHRARRALLPDADASGAAS